MDPTLNGLNSTNAFLNDIIRITKGTLEQDEKKLDKTLRALNEENVAISLHKCKLGLTELIWLGYKINSEGIKSTKKQMQSSNWRIEGI